MRFITAASVAVVATAAIHLNSLYDVEFVQATAELASREGSGVRARWVELPDCSTQRWGNYTAGDGSFIPLKEDLSNAIIATCKHFNWTTGATQWTAPPAANYTDGDMVYDNVIKTNNSGVVIPAHEHQVTQQENGNVEQPGDGSAGPVTNIWNMTGRKASGTQWEPLDESLTVQIYHDIDYPEDVSVIQMAPKPKGWVELPDCKGGKDEVKLADDVSNASVATCKVRPTGFKSYGSA